MPSPVRLKLSAVEDLAAAYAWYETQRAGLGEEFLEEVGKTVESIARHPLSHAVALKGNRRAIVRRFPYSVFYKVLADEILVRCIFNNVRNPALWRRRLREDD
jgi:plasmid stabilization system protein ParE